MNKKQAFVTLVIFIIFLGINKFSFAELYPLEKKWQEATSNYIEKLNHATDELDNFITKNDKYMRFEEQTLSLLAYQTLEVWKAYIGWFGNHLYIKEKYVNNDKNSDEMYIDNWGLCGNLVAISGKEKSFFNQTLQKTRSKELKAILSNIIIDLDCYLEDIKLNKSKK
jgi:hypothetical protein